MPRVRTITFLLLVLAIECVAEEREIATANLPAIEITAPLSRIHVSGWEENHVQLAAGNLEHVDVEQSDGHVHIQVNDPPVLSLTVRIPPSRSLVINGELADIAVDEVTANVTVFTANNPISISNIEGTVQAKSFLAPVIIENVRGNVRAESNQADIRLSNITGDVWARTAGASVTLRDSHADKVELQTLNGVVSLEGTAGPNADYLLASHRGVVNVLLLPGSDVTAELRGDPEVFGASGVTLDRVSSSESRATIGSGNGRLVIESPHGPIQLSVTDTD